MTTRAAKTPLERDPDGLREVRDGLAAVPIVRENFASDRDYEGAREQMADILAKYDRLIAEAERQPKQLPLLGIDIREVRDA